MRNVFKKLFITLLIITITLGCFKLNVKAALNDNGVQRLIYFMTNSGAYESTMKQYIYSKNINDNAVVSISYEEKNKFIEFNYFVFANKTDFVSIQYNLADTNPLFVGLVGVLNSNDKYERLAYVKMKPNEYVMNKQYTFQLKQLEDPYSDLGKTSTQENSLFHSSINIINEVLNSDLKISLGDIGWNKLPKSNIDKVYSFVSRLYSLCLNRQADQGGLNYYVHNLCTGDFTAGQVVKNFYNSPEMKNLNLNDQQFIERCYKAMMDRNFDTGGLSFWKDVLSKGVSRIFVVKGFVESPEFTNICKNYGVTKGSVVLDENRDINIGVTEFIARCYIKALGRAFDVGGLNYHTGTINSAPNKKQTAVDIASGGFFNSPEFLNKNTKDDDFIKICYRTFLGREAESNGLKYYIDQLNSGVSRDTVLQCFANSPEFTNIMAQYGIR